MPKLKKNQQKHTQKTTFKSILKFSASMEFNIESAVGFGTSDKLFPFLCRAFGLNCVTMCNRFASSRVCRLVFFPLLFVVQSMWIIFNNHRCGIPDNARIQMLIELHTKHMCVSFFFSFVVCYVCLFWTFCYKIISRVCKLDNFSSWESHAGYMNYANLQTTAGIRCVVSMCASHGINVYYGKLATLFELCASTSI